MRCTSLLHFISFSLPLFALEASLIPPASSFLAICNMTCLFKVFIRCDPVAKRFVLDPTVYNEIRFEWILLVFHIFYIYIFNRF